MGKQRIYGELEGGGGRVGLRGGGVGGGGEGGGGGGGSVQIYTYMYTESDVYK